MRFVDVFRKKKCGRKHDGIHSAQSTGGTSNRKGERGHGKCPWGLGTANEDLDVHRKVRKAVHKAVHEMVRKRVREKVHEKVHKRSIGNDS